MTHLKIVEASLMIWCRIRPDKLVLATMVKKFPLFICHIIISIFTGLHHLKTKNFKNIGFIYRMFQE